MILKEKKRGKNGCNEKTQILVTETDLGLIHDPGILKENRPISPHL